MRHRFEFEGNLAGCGYASAFSRAVVRKRDTSLCFPVRPIGLLYAILAPAVQCSRLAQSAKP